MVAGRGVGTADDKASSEADGDQAPGTVTAMGDHFG